MSILGHTLSIQTLLQIVWESPDFRHLYMQATSGPEPWKLSFFINPPDAQPWVNVRHAGVRIEDIIKHHNMAGILSDSAKKRWNDSNQRWYEVRQLWTRYSDLIANEKIRFLYLKALFEETLHDGIQYIEARTGGLGNLYQLNPAHSENNGRKIIDPTGVFEVNAILKIIEKFKRIHPNFLGMKIIWSVPRFVNRTIFQEQFKRASKLHKLFKNFIIGFDFVDHEEGSHSLNYFVPDIMALRKANYNIPFYLHAGESVKVYNNTVSASPRTNLRDAIILGSRRIGHGLGLIYHPALVQLVKQMDIAIEVNPVANQLFGYIGDFQTHPAIHLMRSGVPIVISSDAPGAFGLDSYVIDWYVAFMEWSLDIKYMKQIILNSWIYSGMENAEKNHAVDIWVKLWNSYIAKLHKKMCINVIIDKIKLVGINTNYLIAQDIYRIAYSMSLAYPGKLCKTIVFSTLSTISTACHTFKT